MEKSQHFTQLPITFNQIVHQILEAPCESCHFSLLELETSLSEASGQKHGTLGKNRVLEGKSWPAMLRYPATLPHLPYKNQMPFAGFESILQNESGGF